MNHIVKNLREAEDYVFEAKEDLSKTDYSNKELCLNILDRVTTDLQIVFTTIEIEDRAKSDPDFNKTILY